MRLSVMVAMLGVTGYMVKYVMIDLGDSQPAKVLLALALLLVAFYAPLLIVGWLTQVLWFFVLRMEAIGKRFTEGEFWNTWNAMPRNRHKVPSLHPYYGLFHLLSIVLVAIVFLKVIQMSQDWSSGLGILIALVLSASQALVGAAAVRNRLHVTSILKRIGSDAATFGGSDDGAA
jgi:hypothetical protein